MEKFSILTPLTGEYFTTVRLTTGGVCALMGFDVELCEDFKVCVTESLLLLKRNGFALAKVEFELGERLSCRIDGEGERGAREESAEDEISYALLSALVDNVDTLRDGDGVIAIAFEG